MFSFIQGEKLDREDVDVLIKECCDPEDDDGFIPYERELSRYFIFICLYFNFEFFQLFWNEFVQGPIPKCMKIGKLYRAKLIIFVVISKNKNFLTLFLACWNKFLTYKKKTKVGWFRSFLLSTFCIDKFFYHGKYNFLLQYNILFWLKCVFLLNSGWRWR